MSGDPRGATAHFRPEETATMPGGSDGLGLAIVNPGKIVGGALAYR